MSEPNVAGTPEHARGLKLLGVACLVTLAAIAAQFALGMVVNMYVQIPSSDAHASWLREVETAPVALTAHAVLGLVLLAGAFAAGEAFVKTGSNGQSMMMAVLASAGVLCYALVQSIAHSVSRRTVRQAGRRPSPYPG